MIANNLDSTYIMFLMTSTNLLSKKSVLEAMIICRREQSSGKEKFRAVQ